jgi:large subunit ribosomal protein L21
MYAVIKTGGKQYRVSAGDLLVVEKLEGEAGSEHRFDQVLMVSDENGSLVGAPTIENGVVEATLIETRKGEKIKIFKKIRRQGYRRTTGHRQLESVFRVTAIKAGAKSAHWDGTVNLMSKLEINARARGLAARIEEAKTVIVSEAEIETVAVAEAPAKKKATKAKTKTED